MSKKAAISAFILLIVLCLSNRLKAQGINDVYITPDGSSVAGTVCSGGVATNTPAFFNSSSNWTSSTPSGNKIGPGTVVHFCGTFEVSGNSSEFSAQGSGTSANSIWLKTEPGFLCEAPILPWNVGNSSGGCFQVANKNYIKIGGNTPCGTSGSFAPTGNSCDGTIQNTAYGTAFPFPGYTQSGGIQVLNCANCEIANIAIVNLYQRLTNWQVLNTSCSGGACTVTCANACPVGNGVRLSFSGNSLFSSTSMYTATGNAGGNTIQFTASGVNGSSTGGLAVDESLGNGLNNINAIYQSQCTNLSIHDSYFTEAGWLILFSPPTSPTFNFRVFNNYLNHYDHGVAGGPNSGNSGAGTTGLYIFGNYFGDMSNWDDGVANDFYHHDGVHLQEDLNHVPQNFFQNVYIYWNRFAGDPGTPNEWLFLRANSANENVFANVFGCRVPRHFPDVVGFGDNAFPGASTASPFFAANTYTCNGDYSGGVGLWWAPNATNVTVLNNIIQGQKQVVAPDVGASISQIDHNIYQANYSDSKQTVGVWVFSWSGHNTDCISSALCDPNSSLSSNNPGGSYSWQTFIGSGNDTHSRVMTFSSMGIDKNGLPSSSSPALNAGTNLSAKCVGDMTPLCTDIVGNPRPGAGSWTVGAYQLSGQIVQIAPPSGLQAVVQ